VLLGTSQLYTPFGLFVCSTLNTTTTTIVMEEPELFQLIFVKVNK
jgi:hypothetical protein